MRRILAVVGIVLSIGCSPTGPTPPGPTPPPPPPPPAATVAVRGLVFDAASRRVANVRIEVVSGPQQGAVAFSDDSGNFAIEPKLSPMSQIRASKEGYIDSTQVLGFAGPAAELRFVLSSSRPPLDWRGTYDVTLTAAETCTELPDIARRRTFTATVGSTVVFSGARFAFDWNYMYFSQVDDFVDLLAQEPPLAELLPDDAYYMLYGGATGTVTREFAQLDVYGGISYCPKLKVGPGLPCDVPLITCVSNRHQMTMTRR